MQIMDQELPIRRHPVVVSAPSAFTTAASDYSPPADLDVGLIAGFPWGVRTMLLIREEVQYMVYDQRGRNVLSCMPTPELAASYAVERLQQEAVPPESFSHRLAGMRFASRAPKGSHLLMHTVEDEAGRVVGESVDGRAAAASLAVKALVFRVECLDATRDEFASTVVMARVARGFGSKTLPLVFDNTGGDHPQDQVVQALRGLWRSDERLQVDSLSEIMPGSPKMESFVGTAQAGLLRYAARLGGDVQTMSVTFGDPERILRFAFHTSAVGPKQVIDMMYEDYVQAAREDAAEHNRITRPTE